MDRRTFVKNASATAGLAVLAPLGLQAISIRGSENSIQLATGKKLISDKVVLGSTGIQVSRLAVGTGSNGWGGNSNQTRQLGIKGLADLLQGAYDKGVYFWDSADQYGTHPHLNEALKRLPREKIVILSKTHASTEEEMHKDLDRFRKEIGTDYLDIILLHCMTNKNWPEHKKGAMKVLSEAKEKKLIRAHGVSCHTLEALQSAAESPWVQIDLARINPAGVAMDADVSTVVGVLRQMKQSGKVIMGMKIFGDGKLINRKDECIRYALAQDYMSCFTIGLESQDQLIDLEKRLPALS
jgi:predicted aldo/keto reductase-like oxidoreductase